MRAKIVAVHHVPFVTNNDGSSLALRQSPVDNELAERSSLRLHVSVTIAGDIAPSATVEDLSSSARAPNLCRFPVKPSGGFHFVLLLESGGEKLFSAKWGVSSPIDSGKTPTSAVAKADKCIHNRARCQAILRKLSQNVLLVHGINLRDDQ